MSESLFEVSAEDPNMKVPGRDYPITDTQVSQIRGEFERLNIHSMDDRQQLIESATIRPVEKLRDLSAVEARRVLNRLRERLDAPRPTAGSSWDTREEETWIDKL